MLKQLLLIAITFICACESQPNDQLRPEIRKLPASDSHVKRVSLGFGTLEVPLSCQATTPKFDIDCYDGNILCPSESLEFDYEGGFEMPVVKKSHRKSWNQFKLERLPDGNVLVYGISKIKGKTYCYASICPAEQEFGCESFLLETLDAKNLPRFLSTVRTFKLKPLSEFLQTQQTNH